MTSGDVLRVSNLPFQRTEASPRRSAPFPMQYPACLSRRSAHNTVRMFSVWYIPQSGTEKSSPSKVNEIPSLPSRTSEMSASREKTSGDPSSAHFFRITSSAPLPTVPHTTGEPLIIPAFSAAIFSSVSPRYPVWSSAMFVIAEITGAPITFVESSLPPIPHSRTTVSQPFLTKYSNAHAVMSSNSVARSSIESAAGRTASTTDASSLSEISCPSADILSLNFTRYGEVKSPARTPAAFRTE